MYRSGACGGGGSSQLKGSELVRSLSKDEQTAGHVFSCADARLIFRNRYVVFVGDSVMRGFYKDLVAMLTDGELVTTQGLKNKGEESYLGDILAHRSALVNKKNYEEVRQWMTDEFRVECYFTTQVYNGVVENMIETFIPSKDNPCHMAPDYVFMNSCLWDLSWYGKDEMDSKKLYVQNCHKLLQRMTDVLPANSMFTWMTCMPIASRVVGGFMTKEMENGGINETLRVSIVEANYHVAQVVAAYGFDVLDVHYYTTPLMAYREGDGVHWNAIGCRHITELILTFVFDACGEPLPEATRKKLKLLACKSSPVASYGNGGHVMTSKQTTNDTLNKQPPNFVVESVERMGLTAEHLLTEKMMEEQNDRKPISPPIVLPPVESNGSPPEDTFMQSIEQIEKRVTEKLAAADKMLGHDKDRQSTSGQGQSEMGNGSGNNGKRDADSDSELVELADKAKKMALSFCKKE